LAETNRKGAQPEQGPSRGPQWRCRGRGTRTQAGTNGPPQKKGDTRKPNTSRTQARGSPSHKHTHAGNQLKKAGEHKGRPKRHTQEAQGPNRLPTLAALYEQLEGTPHNEGIEQLQDLLHQEAQPEPPRYNIQQHYLNQLPTSINPPTNSLLQLLTTKPLYQITAAEVTATLPSSTLQHAYHYYHLTAPRHINRNMYESSQTLPLPTTPVCQPPTAPTKALPRTSTCSIHHNLWQYSTAIPTS
jgi:hypothetical protein